MQVKVMNEAGFQILTSAMSIGPSQTGYVLEVSADGKNFSPLFSVAANTTKMATGLAPNAYYRLKGNVGEVIVNWSRSCVTEGGAAGNELIPQESLPATADAGTVVALTNGGVYQYDGSDWNAVGGADMSEYWTSAETKTYVDSADTIIYASAATYADDAIAEALAAYTPTSGFSTINGSAITDGSAIVIEAGGDIAPLSAAVETLSAATAGKADAMSVSANTDAYVFPLWNEEGVITGKKEEVKYGQLNINGSTQKHIIGNNNRTINIYTPTSIGNAGEFLVSDGTFVPKWSAATFAQQSDLNTLSAATVSAIASIPENPVQSLSIDTIWKGTQAEYDAITTKDPNTFYIIVAN